MKRIVSCLLALMMLSGLFTFPVSAASATLEQSLDCTQFTADASGDGWSWSHTAKILTLKGVDIYAQGDGITLPDGAALHLSGENSVSAPGVAIRSLGALFYVEGIDATGRLTIHGGNVGIQAGDLLMEKGGPMLSIQGAATPLALTGTITLNSGSIQSSTGFTAPFGESTPVTLREGKGEIKSHQGTYTGSSPVIAGKTYSLSAQGSGEVTEVTGGGTYICGETVTLKASPEDKFYEWSSNEIALEAKASVSFPMPAKDLSVTALPVPRTAIVRFKVADGGGGSVQVDPALESYPIDSVITMEAIPEPGYTFVGWTVDNGEIPNPTAPKTQYTVTSKKGAMITATFAKSESNVTVTASAGGAVNAVSGKYTVGSQITLSAIPDPGYTFIGWEGPADALATANAPQCVLTVPSGDVQIVARFEKIKYDLTVSFNASLGSVTVAGIQHKAEVKHSLAAGEQVTLSAIPADKQKVFLGWVDATGMSLGSNPTITFTMPDQPTTVTALFGSTTNPLHVVATEGGTVLVNNENGAPAPNTQNASMGGTYRFFAKPNNGYIFTGWSISGATLTDSLAAEISLTMPAAEVTLTANFTKASYNLKVNLTQGGSVNLSSGRQEVGAQIELIASPQEGYRFVEWELLCYDSTVSAEGLLSDTASLKTVLTMPACSCQITAKFASADGTIMTTAPAGTSPASTQKGQAEHSHYEEGEDDAPIEGADEGFPLWIILVIAAVLAALGVVLVIHRERRMRNGHASIYRELFAKHNMKNLQKKEAQRMREENEEDEE